MSNADPSIGDGIDYTGYFISNIRYDSKEEACMAAENIAQQHGFFLTIKSIKQISGEIHPQIHMACTYGYQSKSYVPDSTKKRHKKTKSEKFGCKFRVAVRAKYEDNVWRWQIVGVRREGYRMAGFHNHALQLYSEGSTQMNKLTEEERVGIRETEASHVWPSQMRKFINTKIGAKHSMNQIYNETAKMRRERLGGMGHMQWTLKTARDLRYFIGTEFDNERHVTNLFLCHPESISMLSVWFHVIIIDSTYKTKKKTIVELIGVSPIKKSFNIGFALVANESKETYAWILEQLKLVLGGRIPDVIVTDKEGGLGITISEIFTSSTHLLCIWHMEMNFVAKCISLGMSKELGEQIVAGSWGKVIRSNTEGEFKEALATFQQGRWGHNTVLWEYICKEWLPFVPKWAHCYTNRVFHLGNCGSNRVESSHSSLKAWLHTSTSKIDILFLRYNVSLDGLFIEVRRELENSRKNVFKFSYGSPYENLNTEVSLWALELMMEELKKEMKKCDCRVRKTHGIPCRCSMEEFRRCGDEFYPHHLHNFWSTLNYTEAPDRQRYEDHDTIELRNFDAAVDAVRKLGPTTIRAATRALRAFIDHEGVITMPPFSPR